MMAVAIGAFLGLALGLAFFLFSRALSHRVDLEETRRALRVSALVQIVLLPVIGGFVGFIFSGD